jgi:hypothetical protein
MKPSGQYYNRQIIWLAGLLACFICVSSRAAEYCLRPGNKDRTQADSVVCCSVPTGWQGWKDDLKHLASTKKLFEDPVTRALFQRSVWFFPSNCIANDKFRKKRPECSSLTLETRARDSRGQPDIETGLRDFLNETEQRQDASARNPPCVIVSRFGSFHTENSGDLTIWQIRCPSGSQHLVTLLAQRDGLVRIDLGGPDIEDIVPKLDSLKELARSVRITDASLAVPDVIEIDAARLSDEAIRQQLLQVTPVGTPREKVHDFLQRPRLPEDLHRDNGDLWTQIASYSSAVSGQSRPPKEYRPPTQEEIRRHISDLPSLPPAITVRAFWKFDKDGKLHDVEIQRSTVELKPKQ